MAFNTNNLETPTTTKEIMENCIKYKWKIYARKQDESK